MNIKLNLDRLVLLCAIVTLAGCASGAKRTYEVVKNTQWDLDKAPTISEVISIPLDSAETVAKLAFEYTYNIERKKDKFESDESFKNRVSNTPPLKKAFLAMPLRTYNCTAYDFATKMYSISCEGFRPTTELSTKSEVTGSMKLSNAYASRDVEMTKLSRTYLSMAEDAVGKLSMSSDEAKAIDRDLMIGVVFNVQGGDFKPDGCGKSEMTFLDSKSCKETGFKSGLAVETWDTVIIPKDMLEMVVFTKSSNKVLIHKIYGLKQQ